MYSQFMMHGQKNIKLSDDLCKKLPNHKRQNYSGLVKRAGLQTKRFSINRIDRWLRCTKSSYQTNNTKINFKNRNFVLRVPNWRCVLVYCIVTRHGSVVSKCVWHSEGLVSKSRVGDPIFCMASPNVSQSTAFT